MFPEWDDITVTAGEANYLYTFTTELASTPNVKLAKTSTFLVSPFFLAYFYHTVYLLVTYLSPLSITLLFWMFRKDCRDEE